MPVLEQLEIAARLPHYRVFVPRVRGGHLARGYFEHAEPYRNEHTLLVIAAYHFVGLFEHLRGGQALHGEIVYYYLRHHHEKRRGNALSRNVRDDEPQMVAVDEEKVVEIAADFLCGSHGRVDIELMPIGEGREAARQHIRLYLLRKGKLGADTLPLGCRDFQIGHIGSHAVGKALYVVRKQPQLAVRIYGDVFVYKLLGLRAAAHFTDEGVAVFRYSYDGFYKITPRIFDIKGHYSSRQYAGGGYYHPDITPNLFVYPVYIYLDADKPLRISAAVEYHAVSVEHITVLVRKARQRSAVPLSRLYSLLKRYEGVVLEVVLSAGFSHVGVYLRKRLARG